MFEQIGKNTAVNSPDSILHIEVLDKIGENYKILAGGGVFQSKLPINVKVGEVLLAKIIKFKPVTLQLNKLFADEQDDSEVAALLKKLGLKVNDNSETFLRSLLKHDLPVLKSKMEKFLDAADCLTTFNEELSDYLTNMMWNDQNLLKFDGQNAEYFNYTASYLIDQIFLRFKDLNSGYYKEEAVEDLNKILIRDYGEIKQGNTIQDEELASRNKYLMQWFVSNSGSLNVKIKDLAALISIYLLHREYWKRVGVLPEFSIIKISDGYELVKFKLKLISNHLSAENYLVDFEMDLRNLGNISLSGLLTGRQFKLSVTASSSTEMKLEVLKERLIKKMKSRVSVYLQLLISSFGTASGTRKITKKKQFRSINIKA